MELQRPVLVCLCHLEWGGVWQRPQQIMSRLSEWADVLFHEEPKWREETDLEPYYKHWHELPHLELLLPQLQRYEHCKNRGGYHANNAEILATMLRAFLQQEQYRGRSLIVWCYTPMACPVAEALDPEVLVYDCMDELALFKSAPKEMKDMEARLMQRADIVFCGGASMYRNRKDRHPNVHMLLSGVDATHFAQAKDQATCTPDDITRYPHPRIGYWGVLDERIDWPMLAQLSEERPDWHWVLIGPTAKVNKRKLPKARNLHYLGPRKYDDLPRYAKGFDVAMMPFALNEATRFISPTKTLEYMAAGKPIVSTPITDVVDPYQGAVEIAASASEFIEAVERLLNETEARRDERRATYREWIERWSWDNIASTMYTEVMKVLEQKQAAQAGKDMQ